MGRSLRIIQLAALATAIRLVPVAASARGATCDLIGRPVGASLHPRIVSLAPALTEILYAIGAGSDLVADSNFCNYPEAACELPHVGTLETLQLERMVTLRPTLVVTAAGPRDLWLAVERTTKAPVFVAEDGSVAAIEDNIRALGHLTEHDRQAHILANRIERRVAAVAAKTAGKPRPAVFYMVWNDPLQTAGPGSYLAELIRDAGGRNVAPSGRGLYPLISWETLVTSPPQIVLGPRNLASAVRNAGRRLGARAIALDEDILSRPGPRVIEALDLLYRAIHRGP
ncbi:MAG: ABC transporter substrate-binding protein [Cyanobacteria bacterium REEB65]|nr:ABC transporter substrate-binding protein [Cyanobacteria bacterium REEB65]